MSASHLVNRSSSEVLHLPQRVCAAGADGCVVHCAENSDALTLTVLPALPALPALPLPALQVVPSDVYSDADIGVDVDACMSPGVHNGTRTQLENEYENENEPASQALVQTSANTVHPSLNKSSVNANANAIRNAASASQKMPPIDRGFAWLVLFGVFSFYIYTTLLSLILLFLLYEWRMLR